MSQTHAAPFEKYHGAGNDFVVVDASHPAVRGIPDRRAFATAVCDRSTGVSRLQNGDEHPSRPDGGATALDGGSGSALPEAVVPEPRTGADGVLFLDLSPEFTPPRVVMTLVQPDGSVAAMCGNGARCAAQWAHERTGEIEFMIDTMAGTRHATVDPGEPGDGYVEIEMGIPRIDEAVVEREIGELTVTAVDTGVPHAVAFVDDVHEIDLETVAPPIRHADVFPDGANVNVASRVDDPENSEGEGATFEQRTYERGVEGETRACGTGAVAIAAVAAHLGVVDGTVVDLRPPGGELRVRIPDGEPAHLSGPVTREYTGTVLPGVAEEPKDPPAAEGPVE
ncbi:diaminopimelate epimerase [Halalkaliarchaeum desulfuricum]|uniref:Diaminopimelate epimerase n=1 Tax=Halalkaliarchaeum desulfuricum TaxID=2055893 RepID=A0A343TL11_9EURY|nr:diaminopimelate epimerase [Halalkaliarchaeum desulfuricum]AUX09783.1 diaminopimelate epimerase [Halalkaliarchaeum desulfuricum]